MQEHLLQNPILTEVIHTLVLELLYPNGDTHAGPELISEIDKDLCQRALQKLAENGINISPQEFEKMVEDAYFYQYDIEALNRPGKRYKDTNEPPNPDSAAGAFNDFIRAAATDKQKKALQDKGMLILGEEELSPAQLDQLFSILNDLEITPENLHKERSVLSIVTEIHHKADGDIVIYHAGTDGLNKAFIYNPILDHELHESLQGLAKRGILLTRYGDIGLVNILSRTVLNVSAEDRENILQRIKELKRKPL